MGKKLSMNSLRLMDYHLHTGVTIDGKMDEFSACEKALSMGIYEIAFTNHVMLKQPDYKISPTAFCKHWEQIQICLRTFPDLTIRLGLEMDYYPDRVEGISDTINSYECLIGRKFDLILGSVHEVNGGFFSNKRAACEFFKTDELEILYRDYFSLATKAAKSGLFDVIAHPDLIKKYTHEFTRPISFSLYRKSVEQFIEAVVINRVGLEVNTKGLKMAVNEAYPSDNLMSIYLEEVHALGDKPILTVGSDAHKVEDVGYRIDETINHLYSLGIRHLASFTGRKFSAVEINVS